MVKYEILGKTYPRGKNLKCRTLEKYTQSIGIKLVNLGYWFLGYSIVDEALAIQKDLMNIKKERN